MKLEIIPEKEYWYKLFPSDYVFKTIADEYGEDNVDLTYIQINSQNQLIYNLKVRIGDFEISNSKKETHFIRDYYIGIKVKITLDSEDLNLFYFQTMPTGYRGTLELKELMQNYWHSHLNEMGGNYCQGNGPLLEYQEDTLGTRNVESFSKNLLLYIIALENSLRWESIEGGPYRKIKYLQNKTNSPGTLTNDYRYTTSALFYEYKKHIMSLPIKYSFNSDSMVIDEAKFKEFHKAFSIVAKVPKFIRIGNNYYEQTQTDTQVYINSIKEYTFTFKNKEITPNLIIDDNDKEQEKEHLWIPETSLRKWLQNVCSAYKVYSVYKEVYGENSNERFSDLIST